MQVGSGGARFLLAVLASAIATPASAGETATYTYDALGRLVSATSSGTVNNGLARTITYDPAGNRQSYSVVAGSCGGGGGGPVVPDASFENPSLNGSGYVNRPTVTGLAFTGWSGITSNSSDWGYAAAPDGGQAAFMDMGPDGIRPTITMNLDGLTPGASYRIAFQMARRQFYTPAVVRVAMNAITLGDYSPVATTNAYTAFTTPAFTAACPGAVLTFTVIAQGDLAIDQVSVGP